MMVTREETTKLLTRLNRMTQSGAIGWKRHRGQPPISGFTGDSLTEAFVTQYGDRRLAFLRVSVASYNPDTDSFHHHDEERLALIDTENLVEFEFPDAPGLEDLYQVVRFQTANARKFLDDVFSVEFVEPPNKWPPKK